MILSCKLGCLLIQLDAEHHLLRYQWQAGVSLRHFRAALDEVAVLMLEHKIERVVADLNGLPDLPPDVQAWLSTTWLARASTPHARCLAVVAAGASNYNLMVVEGMLHQGRAWVNYDVQFFTDTGTALEWCLNSAPQAAVLEAEWQQARHDGIA